MTFAVRVLVMSINARSPNQQVNHNHIQEPTTKINKQNKKMSKINAANHHTNESHQRILQLAVVPLLSRPPNPPDSQ